MTASLFDLPLRLSDAVALAEILLGQSASALGKPLTDDIRARLASRASGLSFEAMVPLMASLERDPIHPSAWYVCVDGVQNQPLLLRMAPATTPSSGLFPRAILIGRTFVGAQEVVFNVVPFGPADHDRILTFSADVNRAFQPKAFGSRPVTLVTSDNPAELFPLAFEGFRKMLRATGQNAAAFGAFATGAAPDFEGLCLTAVWAAIRAGWREGFTLHSAEPVPPVTGLRRRPFETELTISREVVLHAGMSKDDILERF